MCKSSNYVSKFCNFSSLTLSFLHVHFLERIPYFFRKLHILNFNQLGMCKNILQNELCLIFSLMDLDFIIYTQTISRSVDNLVIFLRITSIILKIFFHHYFLDSMISSIELQILKSDISNHLGPSLSG